jgi:hypothetical protein
MTAQSDHPILDVTPRSRFAFAIRLFAATLILTTMMPFAVLVGLMLFPVLPLFAFPLVVGLLGVAGEAKAKKTGPMRARASIPAHAAAAIPQAART